MTNSVDVRAHIVNVFRRDLIGPGLQDADLAKERLNESDQGVIQVMPQGVDRAARVRRFCSASGGRS